MKRGRAHELAQRRADLCLASEVVRTQVVASAGRLGGEVQVHRERLQAWWRPMRRAWPWLLGAAGIGWAWAHRARPGERPAPSRGLDPAAGHPARRRRRSGLGWAWLAWRVWRAWSSSPGRVIRRAWRWDVARRRAGAG
jgi:hypothetical protein